MNNYSSKSIPVVFADQQSAQAWQLHITGENPNDFNVVVSRDDLGYFVVRPRASGDATDDEQDYMDLLNATDVDSPLASVREEAQR